MEAIISLLKNHNLTISSAESITGGLFASEIVSISGSSQVFKGSIVSYANDVKRDVLKIDPFEIEQYGVVSQQVADKMAKSVAEIMETDIAVSFTGNAGPDVMENKAVGLVYTSIYFKGKMFSFEDIFSGNRNEIRLQAVESMKTRLYDLLNKEGESSVKRKR